MTPREKAEELVKKYEIEFLSFGDYLPNIKSKKCALIAVDEIIESNPLNPQFTESWNITLHYWYEVKNQLEHL